MEELAKIGELIGDLLGELDAQTAMLRLIMRKVGVTKEELTAEAERMKAKRDGTDGASRSAEVRNLP